MRDYNIEIIFVSVYGSYIIYKTFVCTLRYQSLNKADFEDFLSGIPAAIRFCLKFGSWTNVVQQYPFLLEFVHLGALHVADILICTNPVQNLKCKNL